MGTVCVYSDSCCTSGTSETSGTLGTSGTSGRLDALGDGLDEEVWPLVAVVTGLSRQASDGQWKSCLFDPQVAR
jgi:hypothetical protein